MPRELPPGPRQPKVIQTLGWWTRPVAFLEQCRARYGKRFTIRLLATPPFVMISDPDQVKEVFTAPPDVLHPGEGARILESVVGRNSVILLDGRDHLRQRKLMLPAFHGEKMEKLSGLVTEVAEREVATWPRGEPISLHPRLQDLTLEVILRAVFGLDPGERLEGLRRRLTGILAYGAQPASLLPFLRLRLGGRGPWARFLRLREEADGLIFELIDERRRESERNGDRDDVLSMLLVAGHETTASELAWAFERLAREPAVVDRLVDEIGRDDGDEYLTATIQETLRRRPVLPNAAPRLVKKPIEVGGWTYEPGVCLVANSYLIHHDPALYQDPYAFRPERFLDEPPGTYTWIPFGGGRRRCLGASFAMLEMKLLLRAVLSQSEIRAGHDGPEVSRRRAITLTPQHGAPTVLRERRPAPAARQGDLELSGVSRSNDRPARAVAGS